jgi:hypothetical protein
MLNQTLIKILRLLRGRSEIIRTRFELNELGVLVEHVSMETHDKLPDTMRAHLPKRQDRGS